MAATIAQMMATTRPDQALPISRPSAPPQRDGDEQQGQEPGDAGAGQHAGALADPAGRLLQLRLRQIDLLAEQEGEVAADVAHQLADRPLLTHRDGRYPGGRNRESARSSCAPA